MNLTLLSYDGTCCVGVTIDTAAVPDPEVLVECLREGFEEVLEPRRRHTTVCACRCATERAPHGAGPSVERLSPLDAFFLFIEDGTTHMHIASCAVFEGPAPDYESVWRRRSPASSRWSRGTAKWCGSSRCSSAGRSGSTTRTSGSSTTSATRRSRHPGAIASSRTLMGRLMSQELDRHRPLWEAWMVEGLEHGRWALITKIHHCMADGISGNDLLAAILDRERDTPPTAADAWRPAPEPSGLHLVVDALCAPPR